MSGLIRKEQFKRGISGYTGPHWVCLTAPLTSGSWDGDAYSTTAKTLIDLSAVFGAPPAMKAVLLKLQIRDSGSASSRDFIILGPTDAAGVGLALECGGVANDSWVSGCLTVPCSADGDIYYQVAASGASTFDVLIQIWGYLV